MDSQDEDFSLIRDQRIVLFGQFKLRLAPLPRRTGID